MRYANGHDVQLLKEAVLKRDGSSVCYLVLYYGNLDIMWWDAIKKLPREAKKFVNESLLKYEDILEREEHSW